MNERPCIRCQHLVLLEGGHLVYCSHCGAPQIFLSEELQAEIADQAREYHERNLPRVAGPETEAPSTARRWSLRGSQEDGQPWSRAVQFALLSAAITLGLGVLTLLFAPAVLLLLLWVVSAPMLTVTLYNARAAVDGSATSGFAARLGLLTGLLVAFSCAAVITVQLVFTRFVFHGAGLLDAQLAATFAQQRVLLLQRMGAAAQPTIDMFAIPEFRVGLLLSMFSSIAMFYLFLSTVAAGLAGAVLRRRSNV